MPTRGRDVLTDRSRPLFRDFSRLSRRLRRFERSSELSRPEYSSLEYSILSFCLLIDLDVETAKFVDVNASRLGARLILSLDVIFLKFSVFGFFLHLRPSGISSEYSGRI